MPHGYRRLTDRLGETIGYELDPAWRWFFDELAIRFLVATDYLERFGKFVASNGDKVFIPYEASTALGSLGSVSDLLAKR